MKLTLGYSPCPNDTFIFTAIANPESSREYVKKYAQELDDEVIGKHINLYVNRVGRNRKKAVTILYQRAIKENIIKAMPVNIFVD